METTIDDLKNQARELARKIKEAETATTPTARQESFEEVKLILNSIKSELKELHFGGDLDRINEKLDDAGKVLGNLQQEIRQPQQAPIMLYALIAGNIFITILAAIVFHA